MFYFLSRRFHRTCLFSVFFLVAPIFSNLQLVFGKMSYKWGALYSKHLSVKQGPGIWCSTNFHVWWLLRDFIVDDSLSTGISFKCNGSLHCLALWVSRQVLYLILAYIGKMCKSMQIGVILSFESLGKPTIILAALLINIRIPFRIKFRRP